MATFKEPNLATLKFKVNMTADGNIAQKDVDTVASQKSYSLTNVNAAIAYDNASSAFKTLILALANGTIDETSGSKTLIYDYSA